MLKQAELCFTNLWMEMLTVIHMMAALALTEANSLMIPRACSDSSNSVRVVSSGLAPWIFTLTFTSICLLLT